MNMIKNSIIICLALAYALRAQENNCFALRSSPSGFSIFRPSDSLQLGTVNIQSPLPVTQVTSVDIPYSIDVTGRTPEASVSPLYIENYVIDQTKGPDFQVTRAINPTNFTILVLIDVTAIWTAITVHYIVSVLDNIRVGMFVASNPDLLQPSASKESKQITISYQLNPNWGFPSIPKQTSMFLSGLRTGNIKLYLQIIAASISISDSGIISFKIRTQQQLQPIQLLSFSFIIYSNIQTPVGVSTVLTNVPNVQNSLNGTNITTDQYFINFFGMTDYNGSTVEVLVQGNRLLLQRDNNILNAVGSSYSNPTVIETFLKGFNVEGLSFSDVMNLDSIMTGNQTLQECVSGDECTNRNGIRYFDPRTQRNYCTVCPQNSTYNFTDSECKCKQDFYRKDNQCVSKDDLCDLGYFLINGSCIIYTFAGKPVCDLHQVFNNVLKKCQCEQNYVKKINENDYFYCALICKENNQTYNSETKQCECLVGNLDSRGICVECDRVTEVWDQSTKKCACDEANRYYFVNGKCERCSERAIYLREQQRCVCRPPYTGINCRLA